ncbi:SWIM zinc finger family protein [Salinigranum halophilum]|uniref:SWIM zinc finger family protein n=1 Tax=Salinigranum halophilum TaxID=2565931 RepID=UPI0010A76514|nr:SWIM zinc finger family protein [Salinigranum halophilum]
MSDHNPTIHPLAQLDFSSRVRKRAQYEALEFSLVPEGVQVRNGSYADPENHEYVVTVRGGVPVACTCPADTRFDEACKHRVAVAMRRPILDVAVQAQVVADGGRTTSASRTSGHSRHESSAELETTDPDHCEVCAALDALPCWDCFRARFGE